MPERNLLRRLLARNRAFLLTCVLIFGLFEFLIDAIVSTLDLQGIAAQLMSSLPPIMQAMLGEQMLGVFSTEGLLAFGWTHPIVLALGGAVAIVLAGRAIAGEVESGAIELVLAQPISRAGYMTTHIAFGLGALALLSLGGLAGALIGQKVYGVPMFHFAPAFALAVNFWLLHAASFGVALLISAFAREAGRVGALGFVLLLVSYFAEAIGRLWHRAEFLLPWSIYQRFDSRNLLANGTIPRTSLVVLGGLLVLGVAGACWRFARRDLP